MIHYQVDEAKLIRVVRQGKNFLKNIFKKILYSAGLKNKAVE